MELITFRQVPHFAKQYQSTTAVFVAFSQIDYLGNWGPVLSVSSTVPPIVYARRSIVLSAIYRRGIESTIVANNNDVELENFYSP